MVRPLIGALVMGRPTVCVWPNRWLSTAFAIGIGVNPWYGIHDPEAMAYAVVDEAIRNVVAVGADPDMVALLDNFSWGDPRRPARLGELAAAVEGVALRLCTTLRSCPAKTASTMSTSATTAAPRRAADARHHRGRTCT